MSDLEEEVIEVYDDEPIGDEEEQAAARHEELADYWEQVDKYKDA